MSEILFIHIGNSGINLGESYWRQLLDSIKDLDYPQRISRFFKTTSKNLLVPRALFIDTEDFALSDLRKSRYSKHYENLTLNLKFDSSGNYSTVKYSMNKTLLASVFEKIRIQIEEIDNLEGIILCHGSGGGTSSGLSHLIADFLNQELKVKQLVSVLVIPNQEMGKTTVEPYNTVHSISSSYNTTNIVIPFENSALYKLFCEKFPQDEPEFQDLNEEYAKSLNNFTSIFQYTDEKISSINDLIFMLPQQKFITSSLSPLFNTREPITEASSITNSVLEDSHCLLGNGDRDVYGNKVLSVMKNFGSLGSVLDFEDKVKSCLGSNIVKTFELNDSLSGIGQSQVGIYSVSSKVLNFITNAEREFDLIYAKRAYVHWYVSNGLEEYEMDEIRENMINIRQHYEPEVLKANN